MNFKKQKPVSNKMLYLDIYDRNYNFVAVEPRYYQVNFLIFAQVLTIIQQYSYQLSHKIYLNLFSSNMRNNRPTCTIILSMYLLNENCTVFIERKK